MGPWMHSGWDGWAWMAGWHVLWLVLVVAAVLVVVRLASAGDRHGSEAIRILQQRYASGEIDTEEFERRRAALR